MPSYCQRQATELQMPGLVSNTNSDFPDSGAAIKDDKQLYLTSGRASSGKLMVMFQLAPFLSISRFKSIFSTSKEKNGCPHISITVVTVRSCLIFSSFYPPRSPTRDGSQSKERGRNMLKELSQRLVEATGFNGWVPPKISLIR